MLSHKENMKKEENEQKDSELELDALNETDE